MTYNEKIRDILYHTEMTHQELSEQLGIHRVTVTELANNDDRNIRNRLVKEKINAIYDNLEEELWVIQNI